MTTHSLPQTVAETAAADAPASASVPRGRYALWALVGVHVAASATLSVLIACGVLPRHSSLLVSDSIGVQAGLLAIWGVFGPAKLLWRAVGLAVGATLLAAWLQFLARVGAHPFPLEAEGLALALWNFAGLIAGVTVLVFLLAARRPAVRLTARSESGLGVPFRLRRMLLVVLGLESAMLVFSAFPAQTYFVSCSLAHSLLVSLATLIAFTAAVARGNVALRLLFVPVALLGCSLVVMALGPRSTWHLWYLLRAGMMLLGLSGVAFVSVCVVQRCGWPLSHDAAQGMATASLAPARWRYSLRDCLLLLVVLGVALGLFKVKLDRAAAQKQAVAEISAQGIVRFEPNIYFTPKDLPRIVTDIVGTDFFCVHFYLRTEDDWPVHQRSQLPVKLAALKHLPHLRSIDLSGLEIRDQELRHLANCGALVELRLDHTPITDEGARHVMNCTKLTSLSLSGASITDEGVQCLANCRELTYLSLGGTSITDEGLRSLAPLSHLTGLRVHDTRISSRGIAHLSSLPGLSWISGVDGDCITQQAIEQLNEFPSLEGLVVRGPTINDTKLGLLTQLKKIKLLSVSSANVTDDGLMQLAAMPRLEELDVSKTLVTNAGLQRLRKAKPGLRVFPDHALDAP